MVKFTTLMSAIFIVNNLWNYLAYTTSGTVDKTQRVTDVAGAQHGAIRIPYSGNQHHAQCCQRTAFLQDQSVRGVKSTKKVVKNILK